MRVSEVFFSVQAEGINLGVPTVFVRLSGCNLVPPGCKWCDSKYAWYGGKEMPIKEIVEKIKRYNCGNICYTGGEPLLQKDELDKLTDEIVAQTDCKGIEIETNGTISLPDNPYIDLYTISPKLSNSGVSYEQRKLAKLKLTRADKVFKFVIQHPSDLPEVEDFIRSHHISHNRVILMAEATDRKMLLNREKWLVNLCKEKGYRYSPRLQIRLWGLKRGV